MRLARRVLRLPAHGEDLTLGLPLAQQRESLDDLALHLDLFLFLGHDALRRSAHASASSVIAGATTDARTCLGDRGDVGRLRPLRTLALLELHAGTLGKGLEALAGDAAVM